MSEVPERAAVLEALRAIGRLDDGAIDIAEAALLLAALDRPGVALEPYRAHLAELADQARSSTARSHSVDMQVATLTRLLVEHHGYRGDDQTYDDLRNANLMDVIDRKVGLPVALGILWLHAGRAYGGDIDGLGFPSHFLIRLAARGQRVILDVFRGGTPLSASDLRQMLKRMQGLDKEIEPGHYAPVGNRDVLIRLQNNIKLRALAGDDTSRALQVLESMALIAPDRGELWWETAMLHSRLGNLKRAIATLEGFLSGSSGESGRHEIETLLRTLRGRMN